MSGDPRPRSVTGADLLDFCFSAAEHAQGHENVCELHSDDVMALVRLAAAGLGVEPPEATRERIQRMLGKEFDDAR